MRKYLVIVSFFILTLIIPINVSANEIYNDTNIEIDAENELVGVTLSGKAGANITWEILDNKLLLSGSGDMQNYSYDNKAPWYNLSFNSVEISHDITSIGNYAFYSCEDLTSIVIPESVVSIGSDSFKDCIGLRKVTLHDGIVKIGATAFSNCSGLTDIKLPSKITSVERYTFYNCTGLTSVTIPESVTSIGNYAFCYCTGLTSVTIPEGVKHIGTYAFQWCDNLTEVRIPDSLETVGSNPFKAKIYTNKSVCEFYNLYGYEFGELDIVSPKGEGHHMQKTIQRQKDNSYKVIYACEKCPCKYTYTMVSDATDVRVTKCVVIGLFDSIEMPDDVTYIKPETANSTFEGRFKNIELPQKLVYIGDNAFKDCKELRRITIPNGVTSVGSCAFESCNKLSEIAVPDSVIELGEGAFRYSSELTKVILPKDITEVKNSMFYNCSKLNSLEIPQKVEKIGAYAFSGCTDLKEITIPRTVKSMDSSDLGLYYSNVTNSKRPIVGFVMTGYKNSEAEKYARKYNLEFKYIHEYEDFFTVDKAATCTEPGSKSRHCIDNSCEEKTDVTEILPKGHSFGNVEYIWSADYSFCEAKRRCTAIGCGNEESAVAHIETITSKEPTTHAEGEKQYIAKFDVDWSEQQIKTVSIPKLCSPENVANVFYDVAAGKWYEAGVQYVYNHGIMSGYNDPVTKQPTGEFGTNGKLTREQFATMIYRMAGEPAVTFTGKFSDVPAGKYYANAVEWCAANGIVTGYKDGSNKFGVGDNIKRQDIAVILHRYEGEFLKKDVSAKANYESMGIIDKAQVSSYADTATQWCVGVGILTGKDQKNGTYLLDPKGDATRAEVATMIMRYMTK